MRSAEVSSAATSEVTTVKAQGQFSGHIRSDRLQSTRSVQWPHQKWLPSKHKVSSVATSEVTAVKAQGQFSGQIRSDRCQSTAGMSHTLTPIFHTVSMASWPPSVIAYVCPPPRIATNIQYGVVGRGPIWHLQFATSHCYCRPARGLHWYNKALTVSGNWQLPVMTPYNTTTYSCGSAVAPTLLCQYFCCLILLQLNFIALCLMLTARLISCVPFVTLQFQTVCVCVWN